VPPPLFSVRLAACAALAARIAAERRALSRTGLIAGDYSRLGEPHRESFEKRAANTARNLAVCPGAVPLAMR